MTYEYENTHTHTHIDTHTHAHIETHTYIYIYTHTHTYRDTHTYRHTHTGWEINFFAHQPQLLVDAQFYQPLFPEFKFLKESALAYVCINNKKIMYIY